jgi:S-adenosylmethionine:tRNA ribosyltransferase-isomerase
MKIEDFNYNLPENLIAQHPIYPRDYAKLMVLDRRDKSICHRRFYDIIQYLNKDDVLVLNDTRVIRARVKGLKEGTKGKREVFLLNYLGDYRWKALVSPAKRTHKGDKILMDKGSRIYVEIEERGMNGENVVRFEASGLSMEEILKIAGNIPLPPYIKGKIVNEEEYQTVFSEKDGAVAAPTAGLHFTEDLLEKVKEKGVKVVYITLHVGLGTFRPVKEEIEKHKMHGEEFFISEETAQIINESKMAGGKVFACGTTAVRSLETAATSRVSF